MTKILEPSKENFKIIANCIKKGGVVIAPSDTNVALTLNPWKEIAIERAFEIKGRPATSPLTLFILEPSDWKEYGEVENEEMVDSLIEAFWPGPINIIVKKKDTVPSKMLCGGDTISISCLKNPVWRGMMKELDMPVAMTSANLSGQANGILVDIDLAVEQVGDKVDYVLKGEAEGTTMSSTIISLVDKPLITRLGDISVEEIEQVINTKVSLSRGN